MELKNVYNDPEYSEQVEELKEKLSELRTLYEDSEELDQQYIQKYLDR